MSLIKQIKRAAINHGIYNGPVDDNWEPADRLMFHRLCERHHGNYTDYPTRVNQSAEFLEWLDKYNDPEYTEDPYQHKIINPGGIDLKQLTADRQPVNTEGASKQEARKREEMVNENAIKVPQPPKKGAAPDPKKVLEAENKNDLPNKDTVQPGSQTGSETNNQSSGSNNDSADNSGNEQKSTETLDGSKETENKPEGDNSGETGTPPASPEPVGTNKPAPVVSNKPAPIVSNKPAPITNSSTIKTR